MIRLFLVEDEIAMREGIKHRIKWRENGIDFCGEAGDGELAWPQILEKKPDIVITDIKMPFMDGLQLSKLIRRELPDTRIIILSGYDEFEYAQEAIQIGVTDYILKPIMPEEMLDRIRKLAAEIEEEKKKNEARMDWMLEETRERREINTRKLFKALAAGRSSTEEILKLCDSLQLRIAAACYQFILLSIRKADGEIDAEYATSVANALHTITDIHEGCCLFEHGVDSYAILAVALGGNSLGGGKFNLAGSIIGAYTIQAITNQDQAAFRQLRQQEGRGSHSLYPPQRSHRAAGACIYFHHAPLHEAGTHVLRDRR